MPKIKVIGQTVPTGECPQQTDTHAHTGNKRTDMDTRSLTNVLSPPLWVDNKNLGQEALLWQRDCATRLSVEILQLQNIPGLSCGIVCVILYVQPFSHNTGVLQTHTQRQTDGQTDTALRCAVKINHIALHTKYNYQATSVG